MSNAQPDRKSPPEESAKRHNSGSQGKPASIPTGKNTGDATGIAPFSSLVPSSFGSSTGATLFLDWNLPEDEERTGGNNKSSSDVRPSTGSHSWYSIFSRNSGSKAHGTEAGNSIVSDDPEKKK